MVTLDNGTLVFLDANILAKPVTRTLLMLGASRSGFRVVWSAMAEEEALRHMRPRMTSPAVVRETYGGTLTPTGEVGDRFSATSPADRQILADTAQSGASFLVTEDVDDFAETDLIGVGVSAVNPDLFLSIRLTRDAYAFVIETLEKTRSNPRRTAAELHAGIAQQHPRLFSAHADLYDVEPATSAHAVPTVIFRGTRCLSCETTVAQPGELIDGLCADCRRARNRA